MDADLMGLQAVQEVKDWICKTFTLPDNVGQTLVPTKVSDQISPAILGRGESGLNRPKSDPSFSSALAQLVMFLI